MSSRTSSAPKPQLSSNDRVPTKTTTLPISPVYARVLRNAYKEREYSDFWPSLPCSKTSILPKEQCEVNGKRHRPTSIVRRWTGEREVNMEVYIAHTTDHWGFMPGRKLEAHGLKEMHSQGDTFPKCWGVNRLYTKEHLYPQYGDLKGRMFKQHPFPPITTKLIEKPKGLPVGFGCFSLKTSSDPTIAKSDFSVESSCIGLEAMNQQEEIQIGRNEEEAQHKQDTDKAFPRAKEKRNAILSGVSLDRRTCQLPREVEQSEGPVEAGRIERIRLLEVEIEDQLQAEQAKRKARRDATRRHIGQERMRKIIERGKRPQETSFVEKLKDIFMWLWRRRWRRWS